MQGRLRFFQGYMQDSNTLVLTHSLPLPEKLADLKDISKREFKGISPIEVKIEEATPDKSSSMGGTKLKLSEDEQKKLEFGVALASVVHKEGGVQLTSNMLFSGKQEATAVGIKA